MPKVSAEERKAAYDAYLDSEAWKMKRKVALDRAGNRCQVCNTTKQLDVHHRTYERFGDESPDDLTVLCRPCHEIFHEHRHVAIKPSKPKAKKKVRRKQKNRRKHRNSVPVLLQEATGEDRKALAKQLGVEAKLRAQQYLATRPDRNPEEAGKGVMPWDTAQVKLRRGKPKSSTSTRTKTATAATESGSTTGPDAQAS